MTNIGKIFITAIATGLMGLFATPLYSAEATITAASCFPIGHPVSKPFQALIEEVNARGKGVIQIDLKGGAPAIGSPFTLTQKMSKGAYDVVGCTEGYFGNVLKEAPVLRLAEKSYSELRRNGGIAYIEKLFNAKNIHFVARHWTFGKFHLWLNDKNKINKADLSGLHLRSVPVYTPFFKALGATIQRSTTAEVYTYMENGTVQGYGWPAAGWVPPWAKVTKYKVNPGIYDSTLHTMVNLKAWNKLTKKQQDVITQVGLEAEWTAEPGNPKLAAMLKKEDAYRASHGMEIITMTGAEREKWVKAAYNAAWDDVFKKSPKHGKALQKLFGN